MSRVIESFDLKEVKIISYDEKNKIIEFEFNKYRKRKVKALLLNLTKDKIIVQKDFT